ncbi:MAG: FeoA domain-containing protein [Blautia massiliensis (ex Durand et al. 2017)]|uniref:FeoA domain-containing protein n=1 Tax=Blautia massiliensis (ex Durand et al. 2017) TaxID=1737424 RepID=UPI00399B879A
MCGNEGDRHYLETLGFIEGATVRIVSILLGSYIVRIQESKIGISQDFTKMIIVQV